MKNILRETKSSNYIKELYSRLLSDVTYNDKSFSKRTPYKTSLTEKRKLTNTKKKFIQN